MNIAILVLSCIDRKDFLRMDLCVRDTWAKNNSYENIFIYYYYAKKLNTEYFIDKDSIFCNGEESYYTIGYKTITALEYLINNVEFDFLLRTNSSSFIHLNNLLLYLQDKPKNNFYSGSPIPYYNFDMIFATGSGYLLSRDLVKYIVDNKNNWNHKYPDDVALGKLLILDNNIKLIEKPWYKINKIPKKDILENIGDKFHIRCKIEDRLDTDLQCNIIHKLSEIINNT